MREWIISGWIHFILGFVVGWIVLKRPQWFQNLIDKLKAKIGL